MYSLKNWSNLLAILVPLILGDPGADKGGEGKSKRSLLFFVPYFSARLDFPSSPLSAPGSPRMGPSVCFLICVCGTVKTATLLSRVMWNRTCSRACHAAVFFRTSTGSKAFYPSTNFVLQNVFTLIFSLYKRFARNFRRECKKSTSGWHASLKNVVA